MTAKSLRRGAALLAAITILASGFGALAGDPLRVAQPSRAGAEAPRVVSPARLPQGSASGNLAAAQAAPDLVVQSYAFSPSDRQRMRVKLVNIGNGPADTSVLKLTVRRIDSVPVGRELQVIVTSLAPGAELLVPVDAKSILPNAVALAATTFRLDADASQTVAESDENNNRLWHNL